MGINFCKYQSNKSPLVLDTPSKKKSPILSLVIMLPKGKSTTSIIHYIVAGSCHLVFSGFCPQLTKYPLFNQLWTVFNNPPSTQYLRSASNLEEYKQSIKYFHGHFLLFVWGFHLPEVKALFKTTVPAWHSIVDSNNQKSILELFELM